MTSPYRSTHVWSSSSKEPFKKQLLHLFAVEQQQKQQQEEEEQQQQNQRQTCEVRQTDNDRASVEVIVDVDDDDDELEEKKLQINESTPASSDPEKCAGITSGRESEETQIADESSGSSDGEGKRRFWFRFKVTFLPERPKHVSRSSFDDSIMHGVPDEKKIVNFDIERP